MQSAQQTDVALSKVIDWFESNSIPHSPPTQANLRTLWLQRDQLMLKEGVLYRQWKDVPGGGLQETPARVSSITCTWSSVRTA